MQLWFICVKFLTQYQNIIMDLHLNRGQKQINFFHGINITLDQLSLRSSKLKFMEA